MYKPEWGTKRTCPKCGTRFYDLGKGEPAVCVDADCLNEWFPEPVLKSKQTFVAAPKPKVEEKKEEPAKDDDAALADAGDIAVAAADDDADDASLGDVSLDDDDADMAEVIDAKIDTDKES